jgi:hypothetical protein
LSLYALQKLIREINRDPKMRERFSKSAGEVALEHDLSPAERDALVSRDYSALYRLGVHGLLLRPFSILHGVSEPAYLQAIREEG